MYLKKNKKCVNILNTYLVNLIKKVGKKLIKRNQGVNNSLLKHTNQILILDKIKERGEISRAQLSKTLGLSPPSISKNIDILLDKGIIIEAGTGKSSGGRRPVVLKYNYEFCYIIGITLKEDELRVALANLNGDIIHELEVKKNLKILNQEMILEEILCTIDKISNDSKIEMDLIKCITISLPGIIEDNEIMVSNIIPQLQGKRLSEAIVKRFNTDVLIKNDINSKVIGEYWKLPEEFKNIVYISPEKTGVGAGIIIDGKLYEGSSFGAGEIGYMTFEVEEMTSKNKRIDYLENIVSRQRLSEYIVKGISQTKGNKYQDLIDEEQRVNYESLKLAAEAGNEIALDTLEYLAKYYAMAIQNMATLLNPDTVILGGNFIRFGPLMYELIKKYLSEIEIIQVNTRLAKEDFNAQLYGAIYFGIEYIDDKILSI